MAINLLNDISSTGSITITKPATTTPLLYLYNTSNGGGAAIQFSDHASLSQPGNLTYRHTDAQSQGGGASFHFTAEPDTVLVVGSSSVNGRFVAKSAGSVAEVDYGFFNDINTGMYRASADVVRLAGGGVYNLSVSATEAALYYQSGLRFQTTSGGAKVEGGLVIEGANDTMLDLNQTGTDTGWSYINFKTLGTRNYYVGQDSSKNFNIYNDNIDVVAISVSYASNLTTIGGNLTIGGSDVTMPGSIFHTGDSNTYFGFHGNDLWRVVTGGSERLEVSNSGLKLGNTGATVSSILDQNDLGSNSDTALATQQSIKAYVDANADTGVPAILSNGTVPSLNTGITATEINTLLGTMTGFGVSNLPSGTGTTFTISQGQTLGIVGGTAIQAVVNTTNETITLNYTGGTGSGSVTSITEGPGIKVTASATSPTVAVDYLGTDSLVMEAADSVPDADDYIIFGADSSGGGDTNKIQFTDVNLSLFNNDSGFTSNAGTVTSVGSGTGLTGGPFTVSGSIAVDYVGTDSIIKAAPTLSAAVASSDFLLMAASNGNVYETTFGNLPFATNVAPTAPSSLVATIVGETIEIQFAASTTSNIGYYQVWSSDDGGDYGIIGQISPTDFSSTMTVVDTTFVTGGTMSYRVYAVKNGVYSSAATVSKSYTVGALSVTAMTVVNLNTAYYIQYEKPVSRFIDHIEIYMDSQATQAALNRSNASIVYSGQNASYMRNVNTSSNFHQFWVEVVTT